MIIVNFDHPTSEISGGGKHLKDLVTSKNRIILAGYGGLSANLSKNFVFGDIETDAYSTAQRLSLLIEQMRVQSKSKFSVPYLSIFSSNAADNILNHSFAQDLSEELKFVKNIDAVIGV